MDKQFRKAFAKRSVGVYTLPQPLLPKITGALGSPCV